MTIEPNPTTNLLTESPPKLESVQPERASCRRRVLILCPYPLGMSPSQRFRFEQYLEDLQAANAQIDIAPFLDKDTFASLYSSGHLFRKGTAVLKGFFKRLTILPSLSHYHLIFVHREATPLGPAFFERLLFSTRVPVVYDLDDAVFIRTSSEANHAIGWLKSPGKASYLARMSSCVIVCNEFLREWAKAINSCVSVVPTTIDLTYHHSSRVRSDLNRPPVIGWTGSHSTAGYLDLIRPALVELQEAYEFEFRVICDVDPLLPELKNYTFARWSRDTEVSDLDAFDIGVMPVPDGPWERGKVGFKAIQYGAMEIPCVVSETGSGPVVVQDGLTGLVVANTTKDWTRALATLLEDRELARQMGQSARQRIAAKYSTDAWRDAYLEIFEDGHTQQEVGID